MNLSTVRDYIRYATSVFNRSNLYYGHGTNNAIDEAIQLVLGTLDLPLAIPQEFYAANVTPEEKEQLFHNINMRVESRTPTAYIINRSWFCGHEFYVDERVLIPRSPIAELINNRFEGILSVEPTNILDLCTGSGCIGIACAYEYPYAEVDLVDISPDALAIAEINIQSHQLNHRVFPICSDLFTDLPDIQYDLIVSNPPYVDEEDMGDLPEEYLTEPELALASGADGLDITKKILNQASNYLSDSGVLVCEVGNSWVALQDTYPDVPFHWIKFQHGGSGVFWLSKQELQTYQSNFE